MYQSLTSGISFPLGQRGQHKHIPTLFCSLMFQQLSEVKVIQSCPTLSDLKDCSPQNSPDQNTGGDSLFLLQGIFPTQGSNPGLPNCKQILYQLSHKGSPRILEWVAYSFPSGSSGLGIELGSPELQVDYLPSELSGKPYYIAQGTIFNILS